jgi:microcystin-dependent protein
MAPGAMGQTGGSQPHDNMAPFLAINFILSLFGIFPSQV